MHKRLLVIFPILAAVSIFALFLVIDHAATPPWRAELNQYLNFKTKPPYPPSTVQKAMQATHPEQYNTSMWADSYSDCFFFTSNYCYTQDIALSVEPLPNNPEDVWCALVNETNRGGKAIRVVYIAKYQDLYNADWIVYESVKNVSYQEIEQNLIDLGCGKLLEPAH